MFAEHTAKLQQAILDRAFDFCIACLMELHHDTWVFVTVCCMADTTGYLYKETGECFPVFWNIIEEQQQDILA